MHYLYEFHRLPSEFLALSDEEKAFIMACIDVHVEEEKKAAKKAKKNAKKAKKKLKGRR